MIYSLIWSLLEYFLAGYQSFKKENELVSNFYSIDKDKRKAGGNKATDSWGVKVDELD